MCLEHRPCVPRFRRLDRRLPQHLVCLCILACVCLPLLACLESVQLRPAGDLYFHVDTEESVDSEFYSKNKKEFPNLCSGKEVRENCPQSCGSKVECLDISSKPKAYFVWDRVKKIEAKHPNGTICLGSKQEAAKIVQKCRTWSAGLDKKNFSTLVDSLLKDTYQPPGGRVGEATKDYVDDVYGLPGGFKPLGKRLDLTDCDALQAAIDPECGFNSTEVEQFTKDMTANGGSFTISFWARPTGAKSMDLNKDGVLTFAPNVNFYADTSPPQSNARFGLMKNNANGDVRVDSSCDDDAIFRHENVMLNGKAAGTEGWTFYSMSRKNTSAISDRVFDTALNLVRWTESGSQVKMNLCLYDPSSMFNLLEVNNDVLLSPIMMIPDYVSPAYVQQVYLKASSAMAERGGPRLPKRNSKQEQLIKIDKQDYAMTSVLIAPPLIFQTRKSASDTCPFNYSTEFINQQHKRMINSKCQDPFSCPSDLAQEPRLTVAYPGEAKDKGVVFGINVSKFAGEYGYTDLLFSLTDNPFLYRDGRVRATEEFIDSETETAKIMLTFFTPNVGITSVFTITTDFMSSSYPEVSLTVNHYEMLEGTGLAGYVTVQSLVLVFNVFIIVDSMMSIWQMIDNYRKLHILEFTAVFKVFTDLAACAMCIAFVSMRIPTKVQSVEESSRLVGSMSQIKWESVDQTLNQKTESFFDALRELLQLIDTDSKLDTFCSLILIVSLLRVIMCTALHPRLALLTGTIVKALDDLFHATLLIILLMGSFAGIATWRFGTIREDFSSLGTSFLTNFMMMFGNFPDDWTGQEFWTPLTPELMVYTILYFLVVFLLMQNFLLAIVVEAYMAVAEENHLLETGALCQDLLL